MTWKQLVGAFCLGLAMGGHAGAQQPLLQLQGQPYFGGSMTLHVTAPADIGDPVWLAIGLNPLPLDAPLPMSKGPWYIGNFLSSFFIGTISGNGRLDIAFTMPPPTPGAEGFPIALQAYVAPALSNPATLSLDQPYYLPASATILTSPNPTEAGLFSDRVTTGDLNGDGHVDVVVGAWFEDAAGLDRSGRAYVFWGPGLSMATTLESPAPKHYGFFGQGLLVGDMDGDGIEDLIVAEGNGEPPPPQDPGRLHLYRGGNRFPESPTLTVSSVGVGTPYQGFGHRMTLGDFNADGSPDAAIGVPFAIEQGLSNAGRIEVYRGPGLSTVQVITAPDLDASGFLGDSLATADVTGDGIDDLIIGAPRKKLGGLIAMGRVYLFAGPTLVHFKTIDHPLPSGANSRFGNAVAGQDFDGDGIAEVVATDQRNHVFIFWSPKFTDHTVISRPPDPVTGTAISISFGYFAASGDVNGDGLADIIIGEPFAASMGRVYVAMAPFFAAFHVLVDKVPENLGEFGWGVHVNDVDGDGRAELLVGSDTADPNGVASSGRLTMFDLNP